MSGLGGGAERLSLADSTLRRATLGPQDHDLSRNQEWDALLTEPPGHPSLRVLYVNGYVKKEKCH